MFSFPIEHTPHLADPTRSSLWICYMILFRIEHVLFVIAVVVLFQTVSIRCFFSLFFFFFTLLLFISCESVRSRRHCQTFIVPYILKGKNRLSLYWYLYFLGWFIDNVPFAIQVIYGTALQTSAAKEITLFNKHAFELIYWNYLDIVHIRAYLLSIYLDAQFNPSIV